MEKVYTVKELGEILSVEPEGIRDFLVSKRIPFIKVSKGYLISEWDLSDYLEPKNFKIQTDEQSE